MRIQLLRSSQVAMASRRSHDARSRHFARQRLVHLALVAVLIFLPVLAFAAGNSMQASDEGTRHAAVCHSTPKNAPK